MTETGLLIRIHVLCNLLVDALQALDDETWAPPQLLDQLRELRGLATEAIESPESPAAR